MTKMTDVAKMANVSVATVSRVISQPDTVKEETRIRVMETIKQMNYQPNVLARQFRMNETKTVLVVIPDISNSFFSKVLRGIEEVATKEGYKVLLGDANNNISQERDYLDILSQKQAEGLILLTARMKKDFVKKIAEKHPVVLACEYFDGSNIPTVSIDNVSSGRKVTEHLIKLKHYRIAHITGPLNVILSRDRLKGYRQALLEKDIEIESSLIQEGDFTFKSGFNQMMKLLALEIPPTAVFAANDEMAIGAIKAIKTRGLKVPEDIAVVGFDDIEIASIFEPSVTTIAQPMHEIGEIAMNMLLKLIHKEPLNKRQYVLEDKLIYRESCGYIASDSNKESWKIAD